jgi:hypothetical protein
MTDHEDALEAGGKYVDEKERLATRRAIAEAKKQAQEGKLRPDNLDW